MVTAELDLRSLCRRSARPIRCPSTRPREARALPLLGAVTLALLATVYLFFLVPYVAAGEGIFDATGHAFGRDFANIWTAGRLGWDGLTDIVYSLPAYHVAQDVYFGADYPKHAWSYPPTFLPFTLPFGAMPYMAAYAAWTVLTGGLMLYAAYAWGARGWGLALLAMSPAVAINAFGGQNGALSCALLLGALYNLDRRPVLAGILIGCMAYKPHLAVLVPFALMAGGHWRAFVSAAVTVILLVAVSAAIYGADAWITYVTQSGPLHARVLEKGNGAVPLMMPGAFMAARILGLIDHAWAIQAVFTVLAVLAVILAWRRPDEPMLRAAVLLAAAPLAVPYAFNYDLTLVTAAALLAALRFRAGIAWPLVLAGLGVCMLPALVLVLNVLELPLGPILMTGFLAALVAALRALPEAAHQAA